VHEHDGVLGHTQLRAEIARDAGTEETGIDAGGHGREWTATKQPAPENIGDRQVDVEGQPLRGAQPVLHPARHSGLR
jgi:hypothetical protein